MLQIDLNSPIPIYEQVVAEITKNINKGHLKEGESLPSIRTLAGQLDVAANTVARAYQELERNGLIKKYGTKGTFVTGMHDKGKHENDTYFKSLILKLLQEGNNKEQIRDIFNNELSNVFNT